jgi:2-phospho-L-lactate guanylyltransferase
MSTVAVLPVKSFDQAKRRLRTGLSAGERRALAQAMFCDVLIALRRATAVDEVLVISADHGAQRIAGGYGAQVLDDNEHGHNVAARRGVEAALRGGARRALLVPGDTPALDPAQIDELLSREVPERSVLIVPDRHGTGTNGLVLTPPDAMAPSFGPGSRERHLDNARHSDLHGEVVDVPSLALDIDTADDLQALESALAQSHGLAANTRGMLMQLARSRAN